MQNVTIPKPLVTLRDRRYVKKSRQAINLASRARRIKITINFYLSILVEILRKPKLVVTRVEYNIRTNAAWLLKVKSFLSSPTRHDGSHPFNFTVSSPHSPRVSPALASRQSPLLLIRPPPPRASSLLRSSLVRHLCILRSGDEGTPKSPRKKNGESWRIVSRSVTL